MKTATALLSFFLASSKAQSNLRGGRKPQTYRISVFDNLVLQGDGQVASVSQIMSTPVVNGIETSQYYEINLPEEILTNHQVAIRTGDLLIEAVGAKFTNGGVISFPKDADVSVVDSNPRASRRLVSTIGTRSAAVLRVATAGGSKVTYSAKEIYDHLFEKEIGLAKQFEKCSNGALKFTSGGVYEITVPGDVPDYDSPADIRNKALEIFVAQEHLASPDEAADHIIVIVPEKMTTLALSVTLPLLAGYLL